MTASRNIKFNKVPRFLWDFDTLAEDLHYLYLFHSQYPRFFTNVAISEGSLSFSNTIFFDKGKIKDIDLILEQVKKDAYANFLIEFPKG